MHPWTTQCQHLAAEGRETMKRLQLRPRAGAATAAEFRQRPTASRRSNGKDEAERSTRARPVEALDPKEHGEQREEMHLLAVVGIETTMSAHAIVST